MTSSSCEDGLLVRRLSDSLPRYPLNTINFADFPDLKANRCCISASHSGIDFSSICNSTLKPTKIPISMSRSLSSSYERNSMLRGKAFSSPIARGSCEQLCEERTDVKGEAKRLLLRSRTRRTNQVERYPLYARSHMPPLSSHSLHRSGDRPRLLSRPQIPRRGEQLMVSPIKLCPPPVGTFQRSHSDESSKSTSIRSLSQCRSRNTRKSLRNKLGGYSLDIERLVFRKSTSSRCRWCRTANSLRRLVSKYSPRFIPYGIAKRNVARRSLCICGRDDDRIDIVLTKDALIDPMFMKRMLSMFDYAALLILIALILKVILGLLDL
ncbi:hypothetical protein KIN20_002555 [Parelaphostrongylus tenuis]|uniref:Uncharacterized protein n=1 Tax=Parelaphostrongylus tenuis TaxID=148309 RepID=A0AAD5LVX6_PARTN|nr:hypothetical protein KIN20_002555 [Parelaphostrongylus tenuis]